MQVDSQTIEYYFTEKKPIRWPVHEKKPHSLMQIKKGPLAKFLFFFFWLVWSSNDMVAQIQIGQRYPYFSMLESSYMDVSHFHICNNVCKKLGVDSNVPKELGATNDAETKFYRRNFLPIQASHFSEFFFFFPFYPFSYLHMWIFFYLFILGRC